MLMRIDRESADPISDRLCQEILDAYRNRLAGADIVCLQDYDKGLLNTAICSEIIKLAVEAGKKIVVDPSPNRDYSKYSGATVITPNRKEASIAVGFDIDSDEAAAKAAGKLKEELSIDAVVVTMDKEGAYLKTDRLSKKIPTRSRSVYDVTGAGDMVLATLSAALAADCDYETAVALSNITGGIEVEKFGTATVSIEEIINEILSEKRSKAGKLRTLDELTSELDWHRRRSETIVFTNGCFDVVHRGHVEYLKFTKQQGDIVVLGLNSDSSVRTIKGPDRPINNQDDRAEVMAALESVDYIIIFDDPTPIKLIESVKPDVLVKGEDWADKGVVGREFVESRGGKVVLAKLVEGKSSTATIEKIKSLQAKP
jgi:D-beta-D-heptose 7-phosphate kinase/D-beta-D-heptose 1-phosphate adenosyltransferase